jgi:hypothetical protein
MTPNEKLEMELERIIEAHPDIDLVSEVDGSDLTYMAGLYLQAVDCGLEPLTDNRRSEYTVAALAYVMTDDGLDARNDMVDGMIARAVVYALPALQRRLDEIKARMSVSGEPDAKNASDGIDAQECAAIRRGL